MMSILLLFLMAFPITNGLPASPGITHIYRVDSQDASSTNKDQPMPCEFIISSPWMGHFNFSFTPNPPILGGFVKLVANVVPLKDIWLIRASGNGTLHGSEVTFRYDRTFCDFSSTYYWCPAKKGETIKLHVQTLLPTVSLLSFIHIEYNEKLIENNIDHLSRFTEHIHFEKTYKFDYFPKGTYSIALEMFIQDDEKILTLVVNNCTLN
ncbi:hypothetical protein BSL78_19626 [Apostichopus japonicus]|uniref:MD-2-related lipid-recognition domain-containing protein n=1 Tax=Stichopus japonicus TaxID=307972 RepID=A0A2G8K688_STIJA|nr:hypothetical protein BSL78_19626 [Apostichopus japonicus]